MLAHEINRMELLQYLREHRFFLTWVELKELEELEERYDGWTQRSSYA